MNTKLTDPWTVAIVPFDKVMVPSLTEGFTFVPGYRAYQTLDGKPCRLKYPWGNGITVEECLADVRKREPHKDMLITLPDGSVIEVAGEPKPAEDYGSLKGIPGRQTMAEVAESNRGPDPEAQAAYDNRTRWYE